MAELLVIGYPDVDTANKALDTVHQLEKDLIVQTTGAAVVHKMNSASVRPTCSSLALPRSSSSSPRPPPTRPSRPWRPSAASSYGPRSPRTPRRRSSTPSTLRNRRTDPPEVA